MSFKWILGHYNVIFACILLLTFLTFYIYCAVEAYQGKAESGLLCCKKKSIKDAAIFPLAILAFIILAIIAGPLCWIRDTWQNHFVARQK
jgi:hypothetical protein